MKTSPREILIYYNPESNSAKQTIAMAKSHSAHVKSYSFDKNPSSNTSWKMILKALEMEPKDLLDKSNPEYRNLIKGKEFDSRGWLNVLQNYPHLIKAPIAIRGNKVVLCKNPTDIYKL